MREEEPGGSSGGKSSHGGDFKRSYSIAAGALTSNTNHRARSNMSFSSDTQVRRFKENKVKLQS